MVIARDKLRAALAETPDAANSILVTDGPNNTVAVKALGLTGQLFLSLFAAKQAKIRALRAYGSVELDSTNSNPR
jgi:hypothetical protein